jgi:hypothetical protein
MSVACRLAVVAVLLGVFLTWLDDDPIRLEGVQGPNNGWLVVILALLSLWWIRLLERRSWVGVAGLLGTGVVIAWTALENWLDGRVILGADVGPGLVAVLAGAAVLAAAGVLQGLELAREVRHAESRRVV